MRLRRRESLWLHRMWRRVSLSLRRALLSVRPRKPRAVRLSAMRDAQQQQRAPQRRERLAAMRRGMAPLLRLRLSRHRPRWRLPPPLLRRR
jgi:hypothetical protein